MTKQQRILAILVCTIFAAVATWAQEVDVQELESSVTDAVSFINYSGPHDTIDTIDEIRGIGVSLSGEILSGESRVIGGKYRISHFLPQDRSPLRGADVLELLPTAGVDHIDNLRRIISAYLESRYGYSTEDAALLGRLVTIYNAVHRGNMEKFQTSYVPELASYLTPEKAGLSLNYADWAGSSQIVIPLAGDAAPGELSSVPADELIDSAVEETLRDAPDLSLEDRMETADLIDRSVDEEQSQIQEEQASIEEEREVLEERQTEVEEEIAALEEEQAAADPGSEEAEEIEQQIEERQQEAEEIAQQQENLDTRQEANDTRQEAADAADERADEVRDSVANDVEAVSTRTETASDPIRIGRTRIAGSVLYSTLLMVNSVDGEVLTTGDREIIGRSYLETRQGILAVSEEGGTPVLILLSSDDLSFISQGSAEVSPFTVIISGSDDSFFAVIKDGGEWYAGKFDANLNLLYRSSIPVAEGSDLVIRNNRLIVQRKDGRFTALDLEELQVGP